MKKTKQISPSLASQRHLTPWTKGQRRTSVVSPPASVKRKPSSATPRGRGAERPQITHLPKYTGPCSALPCKLCGKETQIARAEVIPICEDCALKVVPEAIAHTIIMHDTFGSVDAGLEVVQDQVEMFYWSEVSKRLVHTIEGEAKRTSAPC
jgi:hypothetical protein